MTDKRAHDGAASALSACADLYRMTTLPPMRLLLRQAALFSFAISLAFFCSCERHRATELPEEHEHEKSGAPDAHDRGAKGPHENDKAAHGEKHEHAAPGAAASPAVGTPAQFFPSASPSPR